MTRESMTFDVVIVGGGPAGLSAAIRLGQRAREEGREISVCVVEKGAEIGAHILSGAVFDPRALDELIADWRDKDAPLKTPVSHDRFMFLGPGGDLPLPTPPAMKNHGNYVISLGNLCRWLGVQAEALGVEIFPGFAAAEVLYDDNGAVRGIATGDMGRNSDDTQGPNFEPGVELLARYTLFAEGARGSLSQSLFTAFNLRRDCQPQTYGLGLKEIWEVDPARHRPGEVLHTIGWPLDRHTYGGSFVYHLENNQVAVGFVVGLDYENPHLSPYEEFQRFKTHPSLRDLFAGGRRVAYGARVLNEGGLQSIPALAFPGGALIGCSAGFLNVARIKGSHTAMKSGMTAADAAFDALSTDTPPAVLDAYPKTLKQSWVWDELKSSRNIRPAFAKAGLWGGLVYSALDAYVFKGRTPWTFGHKEDNSRLRKATRRAPISYPKPDGVVSFDRLSSVGLSGVSHREDQPCHLRLRDPAIPVTLNLADYGGPEQHYCPAGVYEFIAVDGADMPRLQINAQNCIHCKTCDIKDPTLNIHWTPPEGGGGPAYPNM